MSSGPVRAPWRGRAAIKVLAPYASILTPGPAAFVHPAGSHRPRPRRTAPVKALPALAVAAAVIAAAAGCRDDDPVTPTVPAQAESRERPVAARGDAPVLGAAVDWDLARARAPTGASSSRTTAR